MLCYHAIHNLMMLVDRGITGAVFEKDGTKISLEKQADGEWVCTIDVDAVLEPITYRAASLQRAVLGATSTFERAVREITNATETTS